MKKNKEQLKRKGNERQREEKSQEKIKIKNGEDKREDDKKIKINIKKRMKKNVIIINSERKRT